MDIKDLIINQTAGNLYWKDKNSIYLGCNANMARIFKLNSPEEVVGKSDYDFYLEDDYVKKIIENDQLVINEGKEIVLEEVGADSEGKLAIYITRKIPLRDNKNKIIGVIGTSIDITKEKQAEIAKEDFISNMEHDLRTPFSGISGIAHLLYDEATDPDQKAMLALIVKSSEQWMYIQNRIFDVLAVHEHPKTESFYIQDELERIEQIMSATLSLKHLTMKIDCPSRDTLGLIKSDRFKIQLILLSLVGNAVKFTEQGSITITANIAKNQVLIKIADTGIGIPENKIDTIFDKFTKIERSHKFGSHFKGVGLGLYISKKYANDIGGDITVKSKLGKGSEFTLTFPVNLQE